MIKKLIPTRATPKDIRDIIGKLNEAIEVVNGLPPIPACACDYCLKHSEPTHQPAEKEHTMGCGCDCHNPVTSAYYKEIPCGGCLNPTPAAENIQISFCCRDKTWKSGDPEHPVFTLELTDMEVRLLEEHEDCSAAAFILKKLRHGGGE